MRDQGDAVVRDDGRARRAVAADDAQDVRRERARHDLGEAHAGSVAALRRLVHHRVPGDERRGEQPGGRRVGVVPRRDHRDDAARLPAHDVERGGIAREHPTGPAQTRDGGLVEQVGGDLGRRARLGPQASGRRAQQVAELVDGGAHRAGGGAQGTGPLPGGVARHAGQAASAARTAASTSSASAQRTGAAGLPVAGSARSRRRSPAAGADGSGWVVGAVVVVMRASRGRTKRNTVGATSACESRFSGSG